MRSPATIRRWLKETEAMEVIPKMEVYRQGAVMALSCVVNDWIRPAKFLDLGKKWGVPKVGFGKKLRKSR